MAHEKIYAICEDKCRVEIPMMHTFSVPLKDLIDNGAAVTGETVNVEIYPGDYDVDIADINWIALANLSPANDAAVFDAYVSQGRVAMNTNMNVPYITMRIAFDSDIDNLNDAVLRVVLIRNV